MKNRFLLALGITLMALTSNSNAQVIIESLDIRSSGVFGHNDNIGGTPQSGVTINGVAADAAGTAIVADPLDITLTYMNLDLDADGSANDSVTFTVNITGGTNAAGDPFQRAFNQGIDTGFGNLNSVTASVTNVSGTTTDSGSTIFFDGFTGASVGAGGNAAGIDRTAEINGTTVTIAVASTGAFQFFNEFVDFAAPTATVTFDNSGDTDFDGLGDGGVGSVVARSYDLQFSLTDPGGTVVKGDLDLNGTVDFLDINPFIVVLAAGGTQPEGDCNCDGFVDFLDISPFIQILAGP